MIHSFPLIFALALLVKCTVHSAAIALPTGRMDEDRPRQDSLSSALGEDAVNAALGGALSGRFSLIEGRLADGDGTKRIFILSDLGLNEAAGGDTFGRAFATLQRALKDERRDADDLIPMAKRDLESTLLRCMIGRVYRPCWKA